METLASSVQRLDPVIAQSPAETQVRVCLVSLGGELFAIDLRWVPVQGLKSIAAGFGPFFERIIRPTCTLSFI